MKTIVQFQIIKLGDKDYLTDPNTLYVFGFINFNMLQELLTSIEYLGEIGESFKMHEPKTVTLQVWEDSDDFKTWLDYEIMPDDYEIPLPNKNSK